MDSGGIKARPGRDLQRVHRDVGGQALARPPDQEVGQQQGRGAVQQVLLGLEELSPSQNHLQGKHRAQSLAHLDQQQDKGNQTGLCQAQLVPPANTKVLNSLAGTQPSQGTSRTLVPPLKVFKARLEGAWRNLA